MLFLVALTVAQADESKPCEPLQTALRDSEQAGFSRDDLRDDAARRALLALERCLSVVTPTDAARFHALTAISTHTTAVESDDEDVQASFRAVRAIDSSFDLSARFPRMKIESPHALIDHFEKGIPSDPDTGPEVPPYAGVRLFVDGRPRPPGEALPGDRPYIAQWMRKKDVVATSYQAMEESGLGHRSVRKLAPPPPPPPGARQPRLHMHALLGFGAGVGSSLSWSDLPQEPNAKLLAPVDLGVGVDAGAFWLRVQGGVALVLQGQFLFRTENDEVRSTPLMLDVGLAGGVRRGDYRIGASAEMLLPGRLGTRLILGLRPKSPWVIEVRPGLNLATERSVEPTIEILLGVGGP